MELTKKERRQSFFKTLHKVLWPPPDEKDPATRAFSACAAVKYSQGFILKSFHVEDVGELQLPLLPKDASKLQRACELAPFGKISAAEVDTTEQLCWQVDASKVSFPEMPTFLLDTIQPLEILFQNIWFVPSLPLCASILSGLAMEVVRALGLDGPEAQLEANLYKLLFYEAGGHFKFHSDNEKEKGMFATLIVQLPTEEEYKGGKVVIKDHNEVQKFDCHMVSTLGFCYTVFFADCLHKLQTITSGTKLCLVFNLVKHHSALGLHNEFIDRQAQKVGAALEPWLEEVTQKNFDIFSAKLAIPLQHKYTKGNLSLANLKGDDSIFSEVLRNCRDKNKKRFLDVHLCLVSKYQSGIVAGCCDSFDSADSSDFEHEICDVTETCF